jgi:subtilisin family serine protease
MKVLNVFLFVLFASSASARVGPPRRLLKAENGKGIPGEYVVLLEENVEPRGIIQGFINGGEANEVEVLQVYENAVRGFAVRMNLNALFNALKHLDGVTITENQVIKIDSVQTPVDSWGLDRVDQQTGTDNQYSYERDGSNVDVYIVDTGIHTSHADFGGRASFGVDFTDSGEGDNDNNGHGTHVAGKFDLLLARIDHQLHDISPSFTFSGTVGGAKYGIAKNVNLISVKVFDSSGTSTVASILAGIDWLVGLPRPNGAVANLSLGAESVVESLNTAVNNAVAAGVVMVVAGGNANSDACGKSPASAADAITVGATGTDDSRAGFSNFGTCLDIFAPGKDIISAQTNTITGSSLKSGTSMAAPHVAGVAALLLEEDPTLTPAQLQARMLADATTGVVSNPGSGSPNLMLYTGAIYAQTTSPSAAPVPAPVCLAKGVSCNNDNQCCDNKCRGGNGNQDCK